MWGIVIGGLFGFMLTKHIIGAILCAFIGYKFTRGLSFNFDALAQNKERDRQAAFLYITFSVMGYTAKAKGRVTEHEIAFATAYMNKLNLKGELRQQMQDAFREGKMAGFPLKERLQQFKQICAGRHDILLMFLEIQIQLAFADGKLEKTERDTLHEIASYLGFGAAELDRLLEMIIAGAQFNQQSASGSRQQTPSPSQLDNAYKVLGVDKGADERTVKRAYKKLMSQHHPDKLVAKGLPKEMMETAKQKTQDIQAAYELVSKSL